MWTSLWWSMLRRLALVACSGHASHSSVPCAESWSRLEIGSDSSWELGMPRTQHHQVRLAESDGSHSQYAPVTRAPLLAVVEVSTSPRCLASNAPCLVADTGPVLTKATPC